jgi:hypothetical protein
VGALGGNIGPDDGVGALGGNIGAVDGGGSLGGNIGAVPGVVPAERIIGPGDGGPLRRSIDALDGGGAVERGAAGAGRDDGSGAGAGLFSSNGLRVTSRVTSSSSSKSVFACTIGFGGAADAGGGALAGSCDAPGRRGMAGRAPRVGG